MHLAALDMFFCLFVCFSVNLFVTAISCDSFVYKDYFTCDTAAAVTVTFDKLYADIFGHFNFSDYI